MLFIYIEWTTCTLLMIFNVNKAPLSLENEENGASP